MSLEQHNSDLVGWQRNNPSRGRRPSLPPPVWGGLLLTAALIAVLALLRERGATAAFAPTPVPAATSIATVSASGTPCHQADDQQQRNIALSASQQWDLIIEESAAVLRQPGLCSGGQLALQTDRLTAQLELLLARPAPPHDQHRQRAQLQHYEELRSEAEALGVTLQPVLSVAQRAYSSGDFLIAVGAFEAAWRSGALNSQDAELMRAYASSLYNLGYWWTRTVGPAFEDGLAMLATSYALDQRFQIGSGASEELLRELVGPDPAYWPAPLASPALE